MFLRSLSRGAFPCDLCSPRRHIYADPEVGVSKRGRRAQVPGMHRGGEPLPAIESQSPRQEGQSLKLSATAQTVRAEQGKH